MKLPRGTVLGTGGVYFPTAKAQALALSRWKNCRIPPLCLCAHSYAIHGKKGAFHIVGPCAVAGCGCRGFRRDEASYATAR